MWGNTCKSENGPLVTVQDTPRRRAVCRKTCPASQTQHHESFTASVPAAAAAAGPGSGQRPARRATLPSGAEAAIPTPGLEKMLLYRNPAEVRMLPSSVCLSVRWSVEGAGHTVGGGGGVSRRRESRGEFRTVLKCHFFHYQDIWQIWGSLRIH